MLDRKREREKATRAMRYRKTLPANTARHNAGVGAIDWRRRFLHVAICPPPTSPFSFSFSLSLSTHPLAEPRISLSSSISLPRSHLCHSRPPPSVSIYSELSVSLPRSSMRLPLSVYLHHCSPPGNLSTTLRPRLVLSSSIQPSRR